MLLRRNPEPGLGKYPHPKVAQREVGGEDGGGEGEEGREHGGAITSETEKEAVKREKKKCGDSLGE